MRGFESIILPKTVSHRTDADRYALEAAFFKLPRCCVDELMATRAKLYELFRKNAALLLEGFERRYIPQRVAEACNAPFEG